MNILNGLGQIKKLMDNGIKASMVLSTNHYQSTFVSLLETATKTYTDMRNDPPIVQNLFLDDEEVIYRTHFAANEISAFLRKFCFSNPTFCADQQRFGWFMEIDQSAKNIDLTLLQKGLNYVYASMRPSIMRMNESFQSLHQQKVEATDTTFFFSNNTENLLRILFFVTYSTPKAGSDQWILMVEFVEGYFVYLSTFQKELQPEHLFIKSFWYMASLIILSKLYYAEGIHELKFSEYNEKFWIQKMFLGAMSAKLKKTSNSGTPYLEEPKPTMKAIDVPVSAGKAEFSRADREYRALIETESMLSTKAIEIAHKIIEDDKSGPVVLQEEFVPLKDLLKDPSLTIIEKAYEMRKDKIVIELVQDIHNVLVSVSVQYGSNLTEAERVETLVSVIDRCILDHEINREFTTISVYGTTTGLKLHPQYFK